MMTDKEAQAFMQKVDSSAQFWQELTAKTDQRLRFKVVMYPDACTTSWLHGVM